MGETNGHSASMSNGGQRDQAIKQPVSPAQVERVLDKAIERESEHFRITAGQKAALREHA